MKFNILKAFQVMGMFSEWMSTALIPDEDGVVRIDQGEMYDFFNKICNIFGWKADIVVPPAALGDPEEIGPEV